MASKDISLLDILLNENINVGELELVVKSDIDYVIDELYSYIDELNSIRGEVEDIAGFLKDGDTSLTANDLLFRLNKHGELLDRIGLESNPDVDQYRDILTKYM